MPRSKQAFLFTISIAFLFSFCKQDGKTSKVLYDLEIPLNSVNGRIDHMAIDMAHHRLFVCALGNNTLEIVDYESGKHLHTIKDIEEPQGVVYIPATDRIIASSGGGGSANIYDGKTYQLLLTVSGLPDADNIRYDSVRKKIYVGYGQGGIAQIDAISFKKTGNIQLPVHPESFQIDNSMVFINIPGKDLIAIGNLTNMTFSAVWSLKTAASNFPMDIDHENHRLFIGCRSPAKVLIFDLTNGQFPGSLRCDGDIDDLFFDADAQKLYASCGSGYLDVYQKDSLNNFAETKHIQTASGVRTSLFVPELKKLFLAVPERGNKFAYIGVISIDKL